MNHVTLVTWSGTGNFGTSLQAYALERKLELLGYRVKLIEDVHANNDWRTYARWGRSILRRILRNDVQTKSGRLAVWKRTHMNVVKIENALQLWWLRVWTSVYLTGSDQIWNTYVEFAPVRFLSFAGSGRRVAYASSIGTTTVNPRYADLVRKFLLKFDAIGVREDAAVHALSILTGRSDIVHVLDPTLILEKDEWLHLATDAQSPNPIPKHYIVCYLIGQNPEYVVQLKDVVRKVGIEDILLIPSLETPDLHYEGAIVCSNATPSEFVNLIAHAEFVCTDSFHATALSIIFEKEFVEFVRFSRNDFHSQNSRLDELLGRYDLVGRYYENWRERPHVRIDYSTLSKKLIRERQLSESFLNNALRVR